LASLKLAQLSTLELLTERNDSCPIDRILMIDNQNYPGRGSPRPHHGSPVGEGDTPRCSGREYR